jgi:membrane protease subunit HflK
METHDNRGGLWNLLISLLAVLGGSVLVMATGTSTAWAVMIFLSAGLMIALVSWVHMHLANREGLERLELEEVSESREGEALFAEGEVLPARRSREQYEKWVVPLVSVILFLMQAGGVYYLGFKLLPGFIDEIQADKSTIFMQAPAQYVALIVTALVGLILFIRGQFASEYSRIEKQRLLQPASDYVLFGAYLNFAMATMVAVSFKDQRVDVYVGGALTLLLGLMALENLLTMIFEIYRPRMAGRRARLLYQSRLVGLIAKPENLFTTAGKVLNYQFGFKVSETWGYQFLRKRVGILIGIQVILFWLSTSIVVIHPSEVGKKVNVLGGAAEAETLEPGFHVKLPWPFAEVKRYYPGQVHSFIVGLQPVGDPELPPGMKLEDLPQLPKLWSVPAGQDYDALRKSGALYFMAGSSASNATSRTENILVASVPVHYRIEKDKLETGWLRYQNPEVLLQNIAYREIVAYFLESNLAELLQTQGSGANEQVLNAIQAKADQEKLGVKILFVGLGDIRPPAESSATIRGMESKSEDKPAATGREAEILNMTMAGAVELRFANEVIARTAMNNAKVFEKAEAIWREARVKQIQDSAKVKVGLAEGQAEANKAWLEIESGPYRASPQLYRQWQYLETFQKAVANARKYVIAVGEDVEIHVDLNLQESLRQEMYNLKGADKK